MHSELTGVIVGAVISTCTAFGAIVLQDYLKTQKEIEKEKKDRRRKRLDEFYRPLLASLMEADAKAGAIFDEDAYRVDMGNVQEVLRTLQEGVELIKRNSGLASESTMALYGPLVSAIHTLKKRERHEFALDSFEADPLRSILIDLVCEVDRCVSEIENEKEQSWWQQVWAKLRRNDSQEEPKKLTDGGEATEPP
jgi:hypothetical protein